MKFREFLRAEDTEFALRVVLGGAIPLFLVTLLGYPQEGLMIMIGSTFISGIDIPAELPRKLRLMGYSLVSTPLVFIIISLAYPYELFLYPLLAGFIFLFSFLAPYSYHFGKVAFMSNLAIMLSLGFATNLSDPGEIFRSAGLLVIGGLWYILFASIMHFIQRPAQVSRRISEVIHHTAEYFQIRSALFTNATEKESVLMDLTKKQAELTQAHENVRAMLMRDFDYSRQTNSRLGRMLHLFASLVDLFDEALATSWKIQEVAAIEKNQFIKILLYDINDAIANILEKMESIMDGSLHVKQLDKLRKEVLSMTQVLESKMKAMRLNLEEQESSGDVYHIYKPLQIYIGEQMDTLEYMIDIMEGTDSVIPDNIPKKDLPFFETRDQLRIEQIRSHLTFRSGYFRYALRVTITAMTAYFIILILGFDNPNWALFTVLVILKPGYRVSQKRLVWRVVGTSIGVLASYALFTVLHPGHYASSIVFLGAFFGGFAFLRRNYAIASIFFTVYILFLYAFLDRNFEMSAFFRFTNTLLAAVLSIFAIRLLFPYWERKSIKYYLVNSLEATKNYLDNVFTQLKEPDINLTEYRIARKNAQLAMSEFTNSYQRIIEEPLSKRGDIAEMGIWVQQSSSVLAVCSNIGLFLRREPNYVLNQQYLKEYFEWIFHHFQQVITSIKQQSFSTMEDNSPEILQALKDDHHRLKKEVNRLASGYTEVYIARVHEYFFVHELITLYHLLEHMEDSAVGASVMAEGTIHIVYS